MGKIVRLHVEEGERVAAGDTLVRIDPVPAGNRLAQALAQAQAAEAALATAESRLVETKAEHARQARLAEQNLASERQLLAARTGLDVQERTVVQLRAELDAQRAAVEIARHDFGQVTILSDIDGIVVRLNVEEGENVVTGTMNVAGTVLMTIADLSVMEAVVLVDETDVVSVRSGLPAEVTIDAFPDTTLRASVTEVGNASADNAPLGTQQSIDYKVVLLVDGTLDGLRPDLSATAEITIAERKGVLAVPIRALTLRDPTAGGEDVDPRHDGEPAEGERGSRRDVDGVFVLDGKTVRFQPVTTGITGERDFEVLQGLSEGDVIVTAPFETIRRLASGDRVRVRRGPRTDGS
jgi:HlyD family secretion protein